MTDTLEKIHQEEVQLERRSDQIEQEAKQLGYMREDYEKFFCETSSLFTEMAERFSQTEFHWYLSEQTEHLRHGQWAIFDELTEEQRQRRAQQVDVEERQNDLFHERKLLLLKQEEAAHEY